jgi:hypothetical protein
MRAVKWTETLGACPGRDQARMMCGVFSVLYPKMVNEQGGEQS